MNKIVRIKATLRALGSFACFIVWTLIFCPTSHAISACDQDDFVSVVANKSSVPETGATTAQFTFSRFLAGSAVQLTLSLSGTATNGVDYETLPTTVTIPLFQTQAFLTLTPKPDLNTEGDETVTVAISATDAGCTHVGFPDSATVTIFEGAAAPPLLTGVTSRKMHGAAGTFDLVLSNVATNPTTEPRTGAGHTIVFTFDKPLTGGNAAVTEGTATSGAPTFNGSEMTVALTGVTNQQYVTVAVSGVSSTDGGAGGSGSIRIGFLLGDVSQNRVVSLSDLAQVNAQVAQPVTAGNFMKDVNASGTLTVADKGITNTQVTKALVAP